MKILKKVSTINKKYCRNIYLEEITVSNLLVTQQLAFNAASYE